MSKLPALLCALAAATGCETMYQAPAQAPAQSQVEPVEELVPDPRVETIEPVEFAKPPPEMTPAVAPVAPRFVPAPRPALRKRVQPAPDRDPCPACGMG